MMEDVEKVERWSRTPEGNFIEKDPREVAPASLTFAFHTDPKVSRIVHGSWITALSEARQPKKDKANAHFDSKYTSLFELVDCIRTTILKHGFYITQLPVGASLRTEVHCAEGLFKWNDYTIPTPGSVTPQGYKSAITYGKRCILEGLFMLAGEDDDDDGNTASGLAKGTTRTGTKFDKATLVVAPTTKQKTEYLAKISPEPKTT